MPLHVMCYGIKTRRKNKKKTVPQNQEKKPPLKTKTEERGARQEDRGAQTDKQQAKVDMRKAARSTVGPPVACN